MKILIALALSAVPSFAAAQAASVPLPGGGETAFSAPSSTGSAKSGSAAPAGRAPALDLSLSSARVQAIVAASAAPRFDGSSASSGGETGLVPASGMGSFSSSSLTPARQAAEGALPDAPVPAAARPVPPKPRASALEKSLFWSSWWGYHAAFAADFTTTGMILGRGGYETDPLYTRFGNKNMTGVIGSAVVLHAVASVASYELYKEAEKKHGVWRGVLLAAAVGINAAGIETHAQATAHNAGVLRDWRN
ncbi:MAG TPA: hypothetical protein VN915_05130 [Elusimicrobiota bacterium]|nr:hypothetical protein [Elusimicrobiota bacterium]